MGRRVFARIDPKWPVPPRGFCLGSFILGLKDGSILLGKVSDPDLWGEKWGLPTWSPSRWQDKLLLPAGHLLLREHPDEAAHRIMSEMLGVKNYSLNFRGIQNHVDASDHWDLCFIYETTIVSELKKPAWFSELRYFKPEEVSVEDIGRGHADILIEEGFQLKSPP